MSEQEPFTIKLPRVHGESAEDYYERCKDIAEYASRRCDQLSRPEPLTWNFDDTPRFRKEDENSYEMVTPGYEQPESEAVHADWYPIEDAPVGKMVLVYVPIKHHRLVLATKTKEGLWLREDHQPMSYPPTHWMPLPELPEEGL